MAAPPRLLTRPLSAQTNLTGDGPFGRGGNRLWTPGQQQSQLITPGPFAEYINFARNLGPIQGYEWLLGDPGTPAVKLNDTFTAADGTNVTARNSDSGHAWTATTGFTTPVINSNRATGSGGSHMVYSAEVPSELIGTPDYSVEAQVRCLGGAPGVLDAVGITARADTTGANTEYKLFLYPYSGQWFIQKTVAGTNTTLASFSDPSGAMTAGQTRDIALVVDYNAISAVIGGVTVWTVADSALAGPGRAGLYIDGAGNTATTGYAVEYLQRRPKKWTFGLDTVGGAHQVLQGPFTQTVNAFTSDYKGVQTANGPGKGGWGAGNTATLPFVSGTSRTFTGSAIITGTGGVPCFFGGQGIAGDPQASLPVLEAVADADGYMSRVHYNSNVQTMGVFGSSIWYHVLPKFTWFHYALVVADNGTTQALELFINGISRGDGTTTQVTWHANSGPYITGTRGEGSGVPAGGHAMDGTHGPQHVYPRALSSNEILALAQSGGFQPAIIANFIDGAYLTVGSSTGARTTAVGGRGGTATTSTGARTVATGQKTPAGAATTSTGARTTAVGFEGANQFGATSTGARTTATGQKGSAGTTITSTGARTTAVGFEGAKQNATTSTGARTTAQGGAIHGQPAATSTGARTVAVGFEGAKQAGLTSTGARTTAVGFKSVTGQAQTTARTRTTAFGYEGAKQNALTSTGARTIAQGNAAHGGVAQTTARTRTTAVGVEGGRGAAQTTTGAQTTAGGFAGVPIPPPDDPHTFFTLDPGDSPLTLAAHDGQVTITDEPVDASVDDEPVEAGVDEPETEVEVADPNGTLSVDG